MTSPLPVAAMQAALHAVALQPPVPPDVAIAVVNDCLRLAGRVPVADATWDAWWRDSHPSWTAQVGMLGAWLMDRTPQGLTIGWMGAATASPDRVLESFFAAIAPLSAEMLRNNPYRQEEFVRRWGACWGASMAGETADQSAARLAWLDYRQTLAEYERARRARREESRRRPGMKSGGGDPEPTGEGGARRRDE